ncbi:MAG TPA: hypothetical protein VEU47_11775 [Candidatus Cybelea sp.]|nr:hypothetical protein [Candidatus Cybelea sp.]
MGIGSDLIVDLVTLKRAGELEGCNAVVEIGAQQLAQSFLDAKAELDGLYALFGAKCPPTLAAGQATHVAHGALQHQAADAPHAREFWRTLGFTYAAIDIDGSPGSIPLDLNTDSVPIGHRRRYDLVTNFGTTEHVCNQLNAFKVIHDLAKQGGLMMHNLPAQGMMNHGLVNYNAKFFWMLARSNGYQLVELAVLPGGSKYALPDNIRAGMPERYRSHPALGAYRTEDVMVKALLRKWFDIEFVPPIDVPTGTPCDDPALKRRYWTVFEPGAFSAHRQCSYEAGAEAYTKGDFAGALGQWLPLARHGDHQAQTGLGLLYSQGHGVACDQTEAASWFRVAAERGHADAQVALALCLAEGRGVAQNRAEAAQWLTLAAQHGHTAAQHELALRYLRGNGVAADRGEAARWFRVAAESGDGRSQLAIGLMHRDGAGVDFSMTQAHMWLALAAEDSDGETRQQAAEQLAHLEAMMQPEEIEAAARAGQSRRRRRAPDRSPQSQALTVD